MKLFQKQKFDELLLHRLKPNILKRMSFQQNAIRAKAVEPGK